RAEIVRLHERLGATTVYVTHDQVEALSMGDRIGVLRRGRIEQVGTPEAIYRRPRTLFVATFVGTPAMNTIKVTSAPPGCVSWHGQTTMVPAHLAASMGPVGRTLVLGVRPEHVYLEGSRWAPGTRPASAMDAFVDFVELAGDQIFVGLVIAGQNVIAR